MLLKVRVRRYDDSRPIRERMLELELAQNTSVEQQYITGDFVDDSPGPYLLRAKQLASQCDVEVEVIPG